MKIFNYITLVQKKLEKEFVFAISLFLAVITSIFLAPKLSYINFEVLAMLFNLMLIISNLENLKVMDKIALWILSRCKSIRLISMVFIVITFFSSMLVTNDVALITFVPLAILTFKKVKMNPIKTIILQTLAANIGSSLTPMGNPQNLYLFTHYSLRSFDFFSVTIPFVAVGLIFLLLLNIRVSKDKFQLVFEEISIKDRKSVIIYTLLFILVILSVFKLIDYRYILLITLFYVIVKDREALRQVDYFLLATFVCFFIFIGNLSNIPLLKDALKNFFSAPNTTYFSSILFSQVISNVPCAILVSTFTSNWKEVLLGVNVGGLGTLIASLASLISYKLYAKEYPSSIKAYLNKFHIYNFISLLLFSLLIYLYV
jgi:Na+/H+ antiporter NhaD/arsenite permease-like protein